MDLVTVIARRRLGSLPGSVPANKGRKYPAEPLTRVEADALIKVALTGQGLAKRNAAMLAVMYKGGLRIGEVLALRGVDVDQDRGTVRVLHGKGDKARVSYIGPAAAELVGRWKEDRIRRGLAGGPLFCTAAGGPVYPQQIRAMMTRLAVRAGIEKRVHPHGLRHTMASELAWHGVPVNVISKQLGHSNSAVTARYLDHVTNRDVAETLSKIEWTVPA